MTTTTVSKPAYKRGDVVIQLQSAAGQQSGLLSDSVVMTDNLATVTETVIDRTIGSLPMTKVDNALRHTLGL